VPLWRYAKLTRQRRSRSQERAEAAMEELRKEVPEARVEFLKARRRSASRPTACDSRAALQLDLCSQKSVKDAAAAFESKHKRLDYLILNAAVMAVPFKLTEDGFEEQMAATHFGHYTLAGLLMNKCVLGSHAALRAWLQCHGDFRWAGPAGTVMGPRLSKGSASGAG